MSKGKTLDRVVCSRIPQFGTDPASKDLLKLTWWCFEAPNAARVFLTLAHQPTYLAEWGRSSLSLATYLEHISLTWVPEVRCLMGSRFWGSAYLVPVFLDKICGFFHGLSQEIASAEVKICWSCLMRLLMAQSSPASWLKSLLSHVACNFLAESSNHFILD